MGFIYDSYDLAYSNEGDLVILPNGGLATTFADPLQALVQAVRDRILYPKGSRALYAATGVDDHPWGLQNTEDNAEAWKNAIITCLTDDGLILPEDLVVDIAPLDEETWILAIFISCAPTPENGMQDSIPYVFAINHNQKRIALF